MNKKLFPITVFIFIAAGSFAALIPFRVPAPERQPASDAGGKTSRSRETSSRAKTVMPVFLDHLPYAQALQEGVPGFTATPQFSGNNPLAFAPVIPLTPDDLPVQQAPADMRDALGPAKDAGPGEPAAATPQGELSWWSRIPASPAFKILPAKSRRQQSAPGDKLPSEAPAGAPSCVNGLFGSASAYSDLTLRRHSGR